MTSTVRSDGARVRVDAASWAVAVREVIRLRREESAAESAEEDAAAEDLYRVFHARSAPVLGLPAS